ncbi:single-stranded DNA-binding protein [Asticcacaulis sp. W401b]|uniref:single-stranded DNA-binding protein n=1 Tax=Asticcacaulis sp. W401b TaxID=3388666 RepID=UPI0039706832
MSTAAYITLVGNVGRIDAVRTFPDGRQIASFSVAVSRRFRAKGEAVEETDWYAVKATGAHLIRLIEDNINKGDQLIITGALAQKAFERNDGSKGLSVEVFAHDIRFNISKKPKDESQGGSAPDDLDDEIPF